MRGTNMTEREIRAADKRAYPPRSRPVEVTSFRTEREDVLVPTFGVFCLLAFCFMSFSQKLPLGTVAAAGALMAAAQRGRQFIVPPYYRWYLGYLALGAIGWLTTRYPRVVSEELLEVAKVALIGIAVCNVVYTPRAARTFVVGYLALFALYPVRGALYNYINGNTEHGRIAWNFFFQNPNDLAMSCFLPLGLCAYMIFIERKQWLRWSAWTGVVTITAVQMLTQSRGAILALGAGILYFSLHTTRKLRTLLVISALCALAIAATPNGVWNRVAGLSKFSTGNVSQVDPEGSAAGRSTLMRLAWHVAMNNPALGIGLGAYPYENARIAQGNMNIGRDERGERDAHSTYIRAAAETGLAGGVCVLIYIVASIAFCRARRKKSLRQGDAGRWAMALLALEASMVAFALGAIVNSAEQSTFFVMQFVVPCALATIGAPRRRYTGYWVRNDDSDRDALTPVAAKAPAQHVSPRT